MRGNSDRQRLKDDIHVVIFMVLLLLLPFAKYVLEWWARHVGL